MHPAIRILGVLGVILALSPGHWPALAVVACTVSAGFVAAHRMPVRAFGMAWRLRWLFLSIVVLFGWFTPGTELLPALGRWSPTVEGLLFGGQRALVIVLIVAAVAWLLETTDRNGLVRGLFWLTAPLARCGFPHERFATRLALVVEEAPKLRLSLRAEGRSAGTTTWREKTALAADRLAGLYSAAIAGARGRRGEVIDVVEEGAPSPREWLGLALLLIPLAAVAVLAG